MKKTIFTGAGVAIVTPFNDDFTVNHEKLGELIDWQIDNGTDAIIICGTTGEASTLDHDEHVACIRTAVEKTAGRVPVIAGTGSNDTAYSLELSQDAANVGADALLQVTPYYNKTSQAGLAKHFLYVAERVNLPMILYNVPSRTGMTIAPETYAELCKHPNIVATKEASGDVSAIAKTMALCSGELDLYSGNDDQIAALMGLGGKGVISVLSNVAPALCKEITVGALAGNQADTTAKQLKYLDLCNDLFCDVNPVPVKEAMNLMGMNVGPCRMPLAEISAAGREKVRATLARHGLV
ncbi:MAG: 4-hydroxy-tetrahydrodipicolinate synthase [Oscillospiraceae bacterium]|nr:4-hydroxy-tetrahydrodipicolinate synthase [Oscillospiraceae bacterium]